MKCSGKYLVNGNNSREIRCTGGLPDCGNFLLPGAFVTLFCKDAG